MERKLTLTFNIMRSSNVGETSVDEQRANAQYSKDFVSSLGLKPFSGSWGELDLASPVTFDFINKVKLCRKRDQVDFYGFCTITEEIQESRNGEFEWFQLSAPTSIFNFLDTDSQDLFEVQTIHAHKVPTNIHVASGGFYNQYVSEKFVKTVNRFKLTGIDFVWVLDKGKFQAPQWYVPVASLPLGRGIDHEMFDISTLKGSGSWQPIDDDWRTGVFHFDNSQIKKDFRIESPLAEIVDLFDGRRLSFHFSRKYSREFLPTTDFAYNWKQQDVLRNGRKLKQRGLCLNRKAANILIENRIIYSRDLEPLEIVDMPLDNQENLDMNQNYPLPFYDEKELKAINLWLEPQIEHFKKENRPKKVVKPKDVFSLVRRTKKERPDDFEKGISETKMIQFELRLPYDLMQLLKISNGFELDPECTFIPIQEYSAFKKEKDDLSKEVTPYFNEDYLYIGHSADGDWYVIDQLSASPKFGRVLRVSHETHDIEYEWENSVSLVHDVLTGFYEEE